MVIRRLLSALKRVRIGKPSPSPEPASGVSSPAGIGEVSQSVSEADSPPFRTRFEDFDLPEPVLRAVKELGFRSCTPIQAAALPLALRGEDIAGRAQTGTGKTAAFLVAIFTHLWQRRQDKPLPPGAVRALVLAPTRELAEQITRDARAIGRHTGFRILSLYGGADYGRQEDVLRQGPVDLVVATPGRLLDFHAQHAVHLRHVEILVVDEADRMLDMGFIPDVRRIVYATPPKHRRQTLLFSATLSDEVMRLASGWMREVHRVDIEPEQKVAEAVEQVFYIVTSREKPAVLYHLLRDPRTERALVFVNRRETAERVAGMLQRAGLDAALLSGALPQPKRMRVLEQFRSGRVRVLVATDVAGRGLHIEGVSHVINYNIPRDPEDYVHRIGRTGRAGARGVSVTFACEEESFYLPPIEAYTGRPIRCVHPPDEWLQPPEMRINKDAGAESVRGERTKGRGRRPRRRKQSVGDVMTVESA